MAKRKRPRLAVTMGDPAGIGPEVIVKALARRRHPADLVVVGYRPFFERAASVCGERLEKLLGPRAQLVEPEPPIGANIPIGRVSARAGQAAALSIIAALRLVQQDDCDGMVTAPINKASLARAGLKWPGHTEMLADLTFTKEVVMMLACPTLRVAMVTIHERLLSAIRSLTAEKIVGCAEITERELARYFTSKKPRLALAALNPHAGEEGLFGDEEEKVLVPAVRKLKSKGIDITGPVSADAVYLQAAGGRFDAVISLYHDQGMIPIKLLAGRRAVNVTLGLPVIRTSVDHGTAFDIAGKGIADERSLIEAIKVAAAMAKKRAEAAL